MVRNLTRVATLITAGLMVVLLSVFSMSCGVSSEGPDGSKHNTMTGVSPSGYPHNDAQSNDPGSPALSSSSEVKYARPEPGEVKEAAK